MVYDRTLGYDDAMPDAFNDWLGNLSADEWIELLPQYSKHVQVVPEPMDAEEWVWHYFSELVYPYMNEE